MYTEPRQRLIEWARTQLIGPPGQANGSPENAPDLLGILPTERFPCGAIYPTSAWGEGIDPLSEELDEVDSALEIGGESTVEPAPVRRYIPPSSLGFSFFVSGENIKFQLLVSAVSYEEAERTKSGQYSNDWYRRKLVSRQVGDEEFVNVSCPVKNGRYNYPCFAYSEDNPEAGRARLDVQWRRFGDGWIVTTSLCNSQELGDSESGSDYVRQRAQNTLFEVSLRCVIEAGEIGVYPRVDRSLLDEEEQEIELQYSGRHIYAIGHGCAVGWSSSDHKVVELYSETMPAVEVPQMTADTASGGDAVLSLARLTSIDTAPLDLFSELTQFINGYVGWVAEQASNISDLANEDCKAANRLVARMDVAITRMRQGLMLLEKNELARLAFSLANRSMLDQMRQHDCLNGRQRDDEAYRWRPFQLAFLLTTLNSAVDEDDEFRDTVDLIWFPTGGGKTEAYLGLIAFQIVLRRLRHPNTGGGTAILMRYTLRLLTRDQFVRATRLICALELIRRTRDDLGVSPITIGMWVGSPTSPNSFDKAAELVARAKASSERPELVLHSCPWCAEDFDAARNYVSTNSTFHFLCRNPSCGFGSSPENKLPCNIIDEALYEEPPTMLVATVDKFARLAWEERANAFFGGSKNRPPELIIQDELHLIASSLGSVAGLYEAAIDTVLQSRGIYPKYIASTATIRMADQQVRRLYGRKVAVFPPPGLSCDDSYFARTVPLNQRPGRIYIGYLAPLLNRQKCLAPLAATMLSAPMTLFNGAQERRELLDAWWTLMVYHGSLQGVSNSHTAFTSGVRDFMQLISSSSDIEPDNLQNETLARLTPKIAQLTGLQTAAENAQVFARLTKARDQEGYLDAVLATSMISVGLDVSRLASMIINGQPLTTAEYIQASSRVGRSDTPGVVFANYYRDQARSLSHYESFRPYHEAFYRFVEPTSVTPFTYQARQRALHAAVVIVMRHAKLGLLGNATAGDFVKSNEAVLRVVEQLKRRCALSAGERSDEVSVHIDAIITSWDLEAERCKVAKRLLAYQVPQKDIGRDRLLHNHDDKIRGLWPTLQSLRNVENTALLKAF